MSKILRDLLDAEEPIFSLSLQQLERASGNSAADAKLIGDISRQARAATELIGLDPYDTTGTELYKALLGKIEQDNERVARLIGGDDPDDVAQMIPLIVNAVEKLDVDTSVWVLKRSVAKRLLAEMPPEKLMDHLGYRSVDSMLKNEDIDEIYTALRFSEGPEWLNAYNKLFESVTPSDFETRPLRIIVMDHEKYVGLAEHFVQKKLHNITHTKEMGTIVVVPMHAKRMKGIALKSLPLILHYINEVRLYSAFFKLKQVNARFGTTVVETLIADPGSASQMAGNNVHWRVIQRYFGKLKNEDHPEAFQPHVQPEDLHWRRAEEMLTLIDPDMSFWHDLDYVARMYDDGPVVFNLMDISLGYSNDVAYADRYVYHFRESLWNEIFMRYMGHKNLENQILSQLDNDSIAPAQLRPPKLNKKHTTSLRKIKSNIIARQRLIESAEGRLVDVVGEFDEAFAVLEKYDKTVSAFGSARMPQDSPVSRKAYEVASRLAGEGYAIVTGGGHGVMEASNRGAYENGAGSIGFNIDLPTEQTLNKYATEHYTFKHFFGRKVALTIDASAYIYYAGGFGTLDEMFEVITLEQTGIIPRAPIILVGTDFWQPLQKFINEILDKQFKTITPVDKRLITITDDTEEIVRIVNEFEHSGDRRAKGSVASPKKSQ